MNIGKYKIKLAKCYALEHMKGDGSFQVRVAKDNPLLMRASLQSRHSNAKKHNVWLQYSSSNIIGWYCTCKSGEWGLGCCSHVACVLWFLGYARYHREALNQCSESFHEFLTDAADDSSDISNIDEDEDDDNEDTNSITDSYLISQ